MSTTEPGRSGVTGDTGVIRTRGLAMRETKPFWMTSEFLSAVAMIAALAIGAAASDELDAPRMWTLITAVAIGYIVSRGIAKAASRDPARDPR